MEFLNEFRNMTIKRRFSASVLTVVVITMSFFGIIRILVAAVNINASLNQKIKTEAEILAASFSDPLWNLNIEGIKEISGALFQDKEICYIIVKTAYGEEIYKSSKKGLAYQEKDMLVKNSKVTHGDLTIGEVTIGITNFYRLLNLQTEIITIIASILAVVIILWLAISFVSRMVTKSIYELSQGTEEISNGNLTKKLCIDSGDEIGELARKFNIMTEKLYKMIQERDNAIDALGASEEKFNKAFRYSADVIGIIRFSNKEYIEINDAFFLNFGYEREEVIGKPSDEFDLWQDRDLRLKTFIILETDGCYYNLEAAWRTKKDEIKVGLVSAEIVEIAHEPCIVFVWNDITDRKQVEEALQRAHDELENKVNERTQQLQETLKELENQHSNLKMAQSKLVQSEKMAALGTMVAGVAHEINNPINYVYLSSNTLEKELSGFEKEVMEIISGSDDEIINLFEDNFTRFKLCIKYIIDGSNRIKTIVQDLKAFSRLDEAEKKRIDIAEALESTLRLVKTQFNKHVEFVTELKTNGSIECYPAQLNQVFLNVIVNACQAILIKQEKLTEKDGGRLIIRLCDNGKEIIISFEDNGCGMPEAVKSRIFEPFFTTKPLGQGTGLGMSISYGVIEKHHGRIEIESQFGVGTTVIVFLPYLNKDKTDYNNSKIIP